MLISVWMLLFLHQCCCFLSHRIVISSVVKIPFSAWMLKLLHPCHCFLFHLVVISSENADFITNAKILWHCFLTGTVEHCHCGAASGTQRTKTISTSVSRMGGCWSLTPATPPPTWGNSTLRAASHPWWRCSTCPETSTLLLSQYPLFASAVRLFSFTTQRIFSGYSLSESLSCLRPEVGMQLPVLGNAALVCRTVCTGVGKHLSVGQYVQVWGNTCL